MQGFADGFYWLINQIDRKFEMINLLNLVILLRNLRKNNFV